MQQKALNTVIQGLFSKGDHVITTVLEHNSVLRPLYMEQERGVELSIIGADEQADVLYEKLESAIKCNTKGCGLYAWFKCNRPIWLILSGLEQSAEHINYYL